MGFLYIAIRIPSAITITFFLNIFCHARFLLIGALTRLGLYKEEEEEEDPNSRDNYILILDGSSPSLVPIPVHLVTTAIKNRVPIVQFQGESSFCSICLESIERNDEIRELCNCTHLFHRDCLDTWIDQGQVTCPLCRSILLPPKTNLTRCNLNHVAHLLAS